MRYTNISDLYKQVQERKLTPQELEDREKIAKKLPMDDFKKRYGKDAMAVKMAVATNIAKGKSEETELDEALSPQDKKVVDTFYHTDKSMTGKILKTDGKTLEKIGMGAQTIAKVVPQSGGEFKVVAKMDGRSTQDIVNYIKKTFPKQLVTYEALDKEDEPKVKKIIGKLKKASDAHAGQAKDLEKAIKEQPEHEITVGNYTTKHFYMCGSAQTTMKKHADKQGAEELTRMQDVFYKMEKDAMDAGGASDEQKKKSQILEDKIIAKADDMGIKNEVDKYMKLHLTSMLNNKPKLGFGRTDISESLWKNIHKKRERIKRGSGEKMRKPGEKGAPTPAQLKRAKGEETIKEMPYYRKIYDKIHQMTHPKGYDKILKMYIQMHKQGHRNPASALGQMVKGIEARDIAYYINGLVKKGKLPSNLAAKVDFEIDESVNLTEKIAGLVKKSQQTGVPYGILKKSYDRGLAAWRTGHRPGTTPQQWAFARVNSMLTGGKADPDLQKQARASKKKKKKEAYEIGEPYARHTFDVTPGQDYEQSVKSKVASESNIQEWFERPSTRKEYQERYKDEWEEKLQETYNRMRSKISKDDLEDKYIEKLEIVESEYQGRKVKLNDPFRLPSGSNKKFGVYVKNEKGNVVKVTFGDPNMEIKRDDPGRLKSFRARHNCDNPGPKTKARYWSCFQWRKGAKVDN